MNNQDDLKETLLKVVGENDRDFSVVFTGKKSTRVDGLYKESVIYVNNRNFDVWNDLVFTGLHELAHHVDRNRKAPKHHDSRWKAIFCGILKKAIDAKVYIDVFSDKESGIYPFSAAVRETDNKIAALTKQLGKELISLHAECEKDGHPFDDFIMRYMGKNIHEIKKIMKSFASDIISDHGTTAMIRLAGSSGPEREALEVEIMDGLPGAVGGIRPIETLEADRDAEVADIERELSKIRKRIQKDTERENNLVAMLEALNNS